METTLIQQLSMMKKNHPHLKKFINLLIIRLNQEPIPAFRIQPVSHRKQNEPLIDVKSLNLDFLNTLSQGVSQINTGLKERNKLNLNILIGNNNVHVANKNLRNNGSLNNKK